MGQAFIVAYSSPLSICYLHQNPHSGFILDYHSGATEKVANIASESMVNINPELAGQLHPGIGVRDALEYAIPAPRFDLVRFLGLWPRLPYGGRVLTPSKICRMSAILNFPGTDISTGGPSLRIFERWRTHSATTSKEFAAPRHGSVESGPLEVNRYSSPPHNEGPEDT